MKLKKRNLIILIFLLLTPIAFAEDDWIYNSQALTMEVDISSEVNIIPLSSNYNVNYLNINLSLFPRENFQQKIIGFNTNPEAGIEGNYLLFKWDKPKTNDLKFSVNSRVKVSNDFLEIKNKVPFPLENIPKEIEIYTKPTKNIDSNNEEIIKLASSLAQGEDDTYIIVNNLGEWVENNVEYSLTTMTASISQPSSWVLKNKYGVCDEITSLFIAMARSLGIPARFISGVAYTNFQNLNNWGGHAWAEVYFPGYGWVPFDITYKELGFIDPTHIVLKQSLDSDESSTVYESLGTNTELSTKELEIKTNLISTEGRMSPVVTLEVNALKKNIGFGSYNLIEVEIKNLKDHYSTISLSLAKTDSLDIIGKEIRHVVLKPNEKKKEYFIVKVIEDLKRDYLYTIPLEVYTTRDITAKTSFKSTKNDEVHSLSYISDILKSVKEEESKTYSKEIVLKCDSDKKRYYEGEKALVNCSIKNKGNIFLEDLKICLKDECEKTSLGISQEKNIGFELEAETEKDFVVSAKNDDISKTDYLSVTVLDIPRIEITNVKAPEAVSYNDKFSVTFDLQKFSRSNPKNIRVLFKNSFPRRWSIEKMEADTPFEVELEGNDLNVDENKIEIKVTYEDERNREYVAVEEFSIKLENVTLGQRIAIFFKSIGKKIVNLFS